MERNKTNIVLFMFLVAAVALGNGLSDTVYGNFFKDAYNVTTTQRAFLEFPRELPGLLCVVVITLLSGFGDLRIAFLSQILAFSGLTVLGLLSPSFGVMCIFLFINSLGMHLFMPLQDSIGMSLSEPDHVGRRMGQYAAIKTGVAFLSGIIVFVGFRKGWFSFTTAIKPIFLLGAAAFAVAIALSFALMRSVSLRVKYPKTKLTFKREYRYYYVLAILHGVQKQITYVFGSWVIIDILSKGADVMSLLMMAGNLAGVFFMNLIGRWMDRYGVKKMLYVDALTFIIIYIIYGTAVASVSTGTVSLLAVGVVYAMFVLDRLSMQLGIVKSVYLKSIALSDGDITTALSTGTSLDHVVSIIAAQISGAIWVAFGPQWVFFIAAALSLGNLYIAWRIKPGETVNA